MCKTILNNKLIVVTQVLTEISSSNASVEFFTLDMYEKDIRSVLGENLFNNKDQSNRLPLYVYDCSVCNMYHTY